MFSSTRNEGSSPNAIRRLERIQSRARSTNAFQYFEFLVPVLESDLEEAGTEEEALEATKLLLELGADINAVDNNGETAMHGAAYGSFPSVVELLAEKQADSQIWRKPNKHGWTPLFIAEGYRPGNFKPGPPTMAALHRLMASQGISTKGPRPRHIGLYEKERLATQRRQ